MQEPPRIKFKKKEKGGINYQAFVPQSTLDAEAVAGICREYKIHNADVHLRCDASVDQLIDVIEGNRKYMPAVYVLNKVGMEIVTFCVLFPVLATGCPAEF
jgi:uncharacterized protein